MAQMAQQDHKVRLELRDQSDLLEKTVPPDLKEYKETKEIRAILDSPGRMEPTELRGHKVRLDLKVRLELRDQPEAMAQ